MSKTRRTPQATLLGLVIAALLYFFAPEMLNPAGNAGGTAPRPDGDTAGFRVPPIASPSSAAPATRGGGEEAGVQAVLDAFDQRRSGFMTTISARVIRVLRDDRDGSRHQRFLLQLPRGHTLLIAHNIDLADRVPLAEGDLVEVRGQYEWNDRGGVLHWTHHDPDRRREGGWIRYQGRRYE